MNATQLIESYSSLLDAGLLSLSDMLPSEWAEQNRVMMPGESARKGAFSYRYTPYMKEPVNRLHPSDPCKKLAFMSGAQLGKTTGMIEPGIGYIISQNPGNIMLLTGHADLSEEALERVDHMIDNSGIRHLIRPTIMRKRNSRTGDTNSAKEFPGGKLITGSAGNHKLLRQRSIMYAFIDDFDAAKGNSKESGSTQSLIEQRLASFFDQGMKLFYISTPEVKATSNILKAFETGDQRYYLIPCPCCHKFIRLKWTVDIDGTTEKAGITYKLDNNDRVIKGSVGYICQECAGFFNERKKIDWLNDGYWKPTAVAKEEDFYSYQISSLYAPPGMFNWNYYANKYMLANPPGQPQNKAEQQTHVNLCLGEPYEDEARELKSTAIQKNIRPYEVGIIPEMLSMKDGNGKIMLLTCACDLNGVEDDARLDYEVLAHSERGATYSITHGSIGTFVPREGAKRYVEDRPRSTYHHYQSNSVWPVLTELLQTKFETDTGRRMQIAITGIDIGYNSAHVTTYLDTTPVPFVFGVRGKDGDKYININVDRYPFQRAKFRNDIYMLDVNRIKDLLAQYMGLRWDKGNDSNQPSNFMNYPTPSGGKYLYENYFAHYEAEVYKLVENKDGTNALYRWEKKDSVVQNHLWDCRVYNLALRDIMVELVTQPLKLKYHADWDVYVNIINSTLK